MAVNKIIYGGQTLIDLTQDTATEGTVLKGNTFHKADGSVVAGTYEYNMLPLALDASAGKLIYTEPYIDFTTGKLMYPAADTISMTINSSGHLILQ